MLVNVSAGKYMFYEYRDESGEPLGEFILLSPGEAVNIVELRGFEIYPKWRGKGLSYDMLARALHTARDYKFPILNLKVKRDNAIALKLYHNAGFVVKRDDADKAEIEMEIEL